ncbi:MAG: alpha/beta fold hydrolase [Chloroflexota bacterium]
MTLPGMKPIEIDGVRREIFDSGDGEPVVFIHGGGSIECHAVLREPTLADHYRLVHFHRAGYGKSELRSRDSSFEQQAADCRAVLQYLEIERAHFVGESVGGSILLQYVLDYPETVQSIMLLEPVLPNVIGDAPEIGETLTKAGELYDTGRAEEAIDVFFQEVAGSNYATLLERTMEPGWFSELVGDAVGMFEADGSALQSWSFTAEDAARIRKPTLNMSGEDTRYYFRACFEAIADWIPHAESLILPGTTHCMLETNPGGAAERLADFISQHPIADRAHETISPTRQRSI